MIRHIKRLSISTQFGLLLVSVVVSAGAGLYVVSGDIKIGQAYQTGSAYADIAEAVGNWAARTNGLWVKADPTTSYDVGSFLERDMVRRATQEEMMKINMQDMNPNAYLGEVAYHRKNPALVQREISDQLQASNTPIKFRMLSDNPMNRANRAGRFELTALEKLRNDLALYDAALLSSKVSGTDLSDAKIGALSRKNDYYEVTGSKLLYARPVIAAKACLKCHASPETAPASVKVNYPGNFGFDYREGAIVGVISVEVPLEHDVSSFLRQFSRLSWVITGLFLLTIVALLGFVHIGIIRPVNVLTRYADALKTADQDAELPPMKFDDGDRQSRNQIHRLATAIKALHAAMNFFRSHRK